MNKQKLVSIIVPIYNAEPFLEKLISSLVSQTYKNIEIVLLNDGSKDNSLAVIKDFQKKYPKLIKVYTHTNMGVGKTRNRGMEVCAGEYITFVDADDYIDSNFVSTLMDEICDNDIVVSGYNIVENDKVVYARKIIGNKGYAKFRVAAATAKIFRKKFLVDNKILFPSLKISEDILFVMSCYAKTEKIICTSYIGYSYFQNLNSATHNTKLYINTDVVEYLKMISNSIEKNKKFIEENAKCLQWFYLENIINYYVKKARYFSYNELQNYYDDSMGWLKQQYKEHNWRFSFFWVKSERFFVNMAINLVIFSEKIHISKLATKIVSKMFYKKDNDSLK